MKQSRWIIHPFLLAPLPTLLLYSRNVQTIDASQAVLPASLALGAAVVFYGILRAARLDGPRAGLLVSASLLLFFAFGNGVRLVARLGIAGKGAGAEYLTLAIEASILTSVVVVVFKKIDFSRSLNGAGNASAFVLAAFCLVGIAQAYWAARENPPPNLAEPTIPRLQARTGRQPDVYFLVLDAYGRSDILQEIYGFDNSGFLDRLEQKGFIIARRARSNYCQTALSLSATLNYRYLDDLAGSRSSNRLLLKSLIVENSVFRSFRNLGYRLVTFASGFDATESLESDLMLAPRSNLAAFHALVADKTPLWLLMGRRDEYLPHRVHRDRVLKVFDELPASSHPASTPTFTFAHIVSPHPPFVFGEDGSDVSRNEGTYTLSDSEGWCRIDGHGGPDEYARRYGGQVAYLTRRVEEAVDRILATSPEPPIIIIQGDHGPGSHFDSDGDRPNDIRERTSILNACYLPGLDRGVVSEAMTPVNTFRIVLDQYFGSNLGRLDDRTYYSAYRTPFVFIDVTNEQESSTP